FIPIAELRSGRTRSPQRPAFKAAVRLEEVPPGTLKHVVVDGVHVLVGNVAGEVYAVRDRCPGSMAPLHLGTFTAPIVVCPWHNEAYDGRTGRRADGTPGPGLSVLPVAVVEGVVQLAVETADEAARAGRP